MTTQGVGYRTYVVTWLVLLVLTLVLIAIGESNLSILPRSLLLLAGSLVKATLIALYFMHLRFEKAGLLLTVSVGILVTALIMFALPAYDGTYLYRLMSH